jgi:hypothetical protein
MPYRIDTIYIGKDPGPKGPALVHPAGVIWVIAFASSDQVSGPPLAKKTAGKIEKETF